MYWHVQDAGRAIPSEHYANARCMPNPRALDPVGGALITEGDVVGFFEGKISLKTHGALILGVVSARPVVLGGTSPARLADYYNTARLDRNTNIVFIEIGNEEYSYA